jgi:hypothetical protein
MKNVEKIQTMQPQRLAKFLSELTACSACPARKDFCVDKLIQCAKSCGETG